MPKPSRKPTAPRAPKTFKEKVVKSVGRRPLTRNQVAAKMGVKPQAVARALGEAQAEGTLVKTDKGFQKAL